MSHPLFKQLTDEELALHEAKNKDYANKGSALGNFERVSKILGNYPKLNLSDPTVVALTYMMKQLDAALWMLNEGYEGQVETFDKRMQDVHVYAKLARIIKRETGVVESNSGPPVPTVIPIDPPKNHMFRKGKP